ncbi:MAG: S-layer homology domain-containing protein, partial [Clostridia bacterium]|nr:S-layer homology domain-containing protein [Clostridia bacterium]
MKRKGFLLMTLIIFCISCFAGINGFAFSDVEEEHKHFNAITYLTEKNVVNGYGDGTFKPDDTITRAEFLKMALESVQISNVFGDAAVETGFSDVDGKVTTTTTKDADGKEVKTEKVVGQHWAAGYIKLAVDKGIVNGYGDGTFKPDAPVKYEEAIKMIVCTLGRDALAKDKVTKLNLNLWPDAYLSVGNDLMISKSTDYALETDATRANVAQMLYNVKDVKVIVSSNVNIDDGSSKPIVSGGGGSYGGGGGGGYGGPIPPVAPTYPTPGNGGDVTNSTTEVSGHVKYGTVVAAVKQVNGVKKPLIIDDA